MHREEGWFGLQTKPPGAACPRRTGVLRAQRWGVFCCATATLFEHWSPNPIMFQ